MATRTIGPNSTYSDKLFALIPGEITAAFLGIHAIIDPTGSRHNALLAIVVIVLVIINVPYLKRFQNVQDNGQIAFTSGAFVLWAASIENKRLIDYGIEPTYVAVALILYTLCIPFFIKPRNEP